jgi:hypothetical protein
VLIDLEYEPGVKVRETVSALGRAPSLALVYRRDKRTRTMLIVRGGARAIPFRRSERETSTPAGGRSEPRSGQVGTSALIDVSNMLIDVSRITCLYGL